MNWRWRLKKLSIPTFVGRRSSEHRKGVLIPAKRTEMKYKIKSFIVGVKEARGILCTTAYGRPARKACNMGRKLSNGFLGLLKLRMG